MKAVLIVGKVYRLRMERATVIAVIGRVVPWRRLLENLKNIVDDCILSWYAIVSKIEHHHFPGIEVLNGSFSWVSMIETHTKEESIT